MGDKWKPRRVLEADWAWVCGFLADAGCGLFTFGCSGKQFGIIETTDGVVKAYVETIRGELHWRAWAVASPQCVISGRGPTELATCEMLATCVMLRARRLVEKHPLALELSNHRKEVCCAI